MDSSDGVKELFTIPFDLDCVYSNVPERKSL